MNINQLWAEMEEEQEWREKELRFFQNKLSQIPEENTSDRELFRKATVLLIYAHYEGFCKFALTHYVRAVNSSGLECSDAIPAIAAASLSDLFSALRNPGAKCDEFRNELPDDTKLHIFARDREFVTDLRRFLSRPVNIPEDVIDTESNLKPVVLRKNLFRLGFPHDAFATLEGKINLLLNIRNSVAHGNFKLGIPSQTYITIQDASQFVMSAIKRVVMNAIEESSFRNPHLISPAN